MKRISMLGFAAACMLGTTALVSSPALAKAKERADAQPSLKGLSKEERAGLVEAQKAIQAKDAAAAATALAALQPQIKTNDGRYAFGTLQVQLGELTNDPKLQLQGIDSMLASGIAPASGLPTLLNNQAALAIALKDNAKAEAALNRLTQIAPNNTDTLVTLAQLRANQNQVPEALQYLDRAIAANKAAGRPVPEDWYKFGIGRASKARLIPQTTKLTREWVAAYPSPQNWRDALLLYRQAANPDRPILIDLYRLLRFQKAMNGAGDYYMLANALNQTGYPGEVKSVLDEGIAVRAVDPSKEEFRALMGAGSRVAADKAALPASEKSALAAPTGTPAQKIGDAYLGYGDYAKAIVLYRAALQKGGADTNLVNTRLGMALAMTGDKAGAETAFKAVGGPRADLGAFLLLWLSQRA